MTVGHASVGLCQNMFGIFISCTGHLETHFNLFFFHSFFVSIILLFYSSFCCTLLVVLWWKIASKHTITVIMDLISSYIGGEKWDNHRGRWLTGGLIGNHANVWFEFGTHRPPNTKRTYTLMRSLSLSLPSLPLISYCNGIVNDRKQLRCLVECIFFHQRANGHNHCNVINLFYWNN